MSFLYSRLLIVYTVLLLVFPSLLHTSFIVSAAPPVPLTYPAYATVGTTLYVLGGSPDAKNATLGFYSLSLATTWYTQAPPWTALPTSSGNVQAPTIWQESMVVTSDNSRIFIWDFPNPTVSFNIPNKTWTATPMAGYSIRIPGLTALTDPGSLSPGTVYVPSGCPVTVGTAMSSLTCVVDLPTASFVTMTAPVQAVGFTYYSFAHNSFTNSMMLYGGIGPNKETNPNMIGTPLGLPAGTTGAWTLQAVQGTSPGDLNSHCMVQTTDGTRMILFGGISSNNVVSSGLFIFNLVTSTWTQGTNPGAANARYGHICATNGDSFIAWGGQSEPNKVVTNSTPLVYNIPTNKWVETFVVSGTPPAPTGSPGDSGGAPGSGGNQVGPSPSPNNGGSKSSSSGGVIGGAVGAVLVVILIGFFAFRWRKRSRSRTPPLPTAMEKSNIGEGSTQVQKKGGVFSWRNRSGDIDDDDVENSGNGAAKRVSEITTNLTYSSRPSRSSNTSESSPPPPPSSPPKRRPPPPPPSPPPLEPPTLPPARKSLASKKKKGPQNYDESLPEKGRESPLDGYYGKDTLLLAKNPQRHLVEDNGPQYLSPSIRRPRPRNPQQHTVDDPTNLETWNVRNSIHGPQADIGPVPQAPQAIDFANGKSADNDPHGEMEVSIPKAPHATDATGYGASAVGGPHGEMNPGIPQAPQSLDFEGKGSEDVINRNSYIPSPAGSFVPPPLGRYFLPPPGTFAPSPLSALVPPPPPPSNVSSPARDRDPMVQRESDLMKKKLKLLQAQHELTLQRIQLEEESQKFKSERRKGA